MLSHFDCLYQRQAESLLHYVQAISPDSQAPVNIAILSSRYQQHVEGLYPLWQQQQRPWHFVVVDCDYRASVEKWQQSSLPGLAQYKLLPLLGWQRVEIEPYRLSLNVLFADSELAWKQVLADVHCFIIDEAIENYRDILRMSVPQAYFLCRQVHLEGLQQALREASFQCKQEVLAEADWCIVYAESRRPVVRSAASKGREVAIIGAGVAGAGVAFALAHRGWKVKIIDPVQWERHPLFNYASGAVTPLLSSDDDYKARLSRAGVLRAHARWQEIAEQVGIRFCGTVELNRDKGHAKDLLETVAALDLPYEWVHLVSPAQASEIAGIPIQQEGAFFPYGMQIPPLRLAFALWQHPNIERLVWEVQRIERLESGYRLHGDAGQVIETPFVVIANAMQSVPLLERSALTQRTLKSGQVCSALGRLQSLHALAGEVMMIPSHFVQGGPQCVIGGQGYYLPEQSGYCVMGSTYVHNELNPQLSAEGQAIIWSKMPIELPVALSTLQESHQLKGRACVRAVVQGRLPVVGELASASGVWLACAFASHGMTWSALAGDCIAAALEGEPIPLEKDLFTAISLK